jgi:hypothetical protein
MKFETQEMRSQPILLFETELARYFRVFIIKQFPLTGGMTVEFKLERQEKGKKVEKSE